MLSKTYCTDVFSPFFARFATVYRVCQSLGLSQAGTDVGLYAFVAFTPRASRQELKKYVSAIKYLSVYIVVLLLLFFSS